MGCDEDENELPHVFTRTFMFSCSFINLNPSAPFTRAFSAFFLCVCVCFIMNQLQVMEQELTQEESRKRWSRGRQQAKNDVQLHANEGYSHRVIIKIHQVPPKKFQRKKDSKGSKMKMLLLYVEKNTASDGQLLSY